MTVMLYSGFLYPLYNVYEQGKPPCAPKKNGGNSQK